MSIRILFSSIAALLCAVLVTTTVQAQNQYKRLTVIEEFTSATCGPCVPASEALLGTVKMSKGIVSIRYHMWWPAAGDPWNVENPNDNKARRDYYGVQGIPYARLNGVEISPTNAGAMLAAAAADNAKGAGVSIEVTESGTGNNRSVTVKVNTDISLTNHKLQVAVVSRYAPYPGLASSLPNSNGEEEFYDAMNLMLPDAGGTSLNMNAGAEQTFTFNYTKKAGYTWPKDQQYIIAFVQNEATKAVLNAGTNRKVVYAEVELVSPAWEPIDKRAQATKQVRITNPTDKELVCNIEVTNYANLQQSGWDVTLPSNEVVLGPNQSSVVGVVSTANNRAFFAPIEFTVTPFTTSESEDNGVVFGYLTNGSRVGVYYGASQFAQGAAVAALSTKYAQDVAYVPLSSDVLAAFPPQTSFEAVILPHAYNSPAAILTLVPIAEAMLQAKKGVWLSSPTGLAIAMNAQNQSVPGIPECKAFFERYGIAWKSQSQRFSGQYVTQFDAAGVANDVIGNGWSAKVNDATQQWPVFTPYQDIISLQNALCKSFLFTDGNSTNIAGVRYEQGNAKLVFTTFGAEHVGVEAKRNQLSERVIQYLLPSTQSNAPQITVNAETISFGSVPVGSTVDRTLTITNSGTAELQLTDVSIVGPDAVSFDVVDGRISGGQIVTVQPGSTYNVRIRFQPMSAKASFTASVSISANAVAPGVQLTAAAVTSVETEAFSETGAIAMRLNGANPVTDHSAIQLTSSQPVVVTVVDNSGRTVATLHNGVVNGTEQIALQSASLPSGMYTVVASTGDERAVLTIVVAR